MMDAIDVQMLAMLQENGRVSQHELAKAVGLSAPAVSDRLRKLEERGVIRGYAALLDPRLLGQDIAAFVAVGISGSRHHGDFRARAAERPEVVECHAVTGEGSYLLKVRVGNTPSLEHLLGEIQSWPGVQRTTTSMVLSTVKETTEVPLPRVSRSGRGSAEDEPAPGDLLMVPFRHHS